MDENMVNNLKSESRWLRLVFMFLFAMVAYVAGCLILVLSVIQTIYGFIKGDANARLLHFSDGLNEFLYQIFQFLTYNSDEKPYPFSDWPGEQVSFTEQDSDRRESDSERPDSEVPDAESDKTP